MVVREVDDAEAAFADEAGDLELAEPRSSGKRVLAAETGRRGIAERGDRRRHYRAIVRASQAYIVSGMRMSALPILLQGQ